MQPKLIFLDVDGVLNKYPATWKHSPLLPLEPACMYRLCAIVNRTGAGIVVSSSWRLFPDAYAGLLDTLTNPPYSIPKDTFLGVTPDLPTVTRGDEIQLWLYSHPRFIDCQFVILDDSEDMGALLPRLVQTNLADGLTEAHAQQAIRLLEAS